MPIQWETLLQSNAVFHWLRGNLESALISQSCSKNGFCSRKCAAAENTNAIKRCNSDTFVYPRLCLYLCLCLCRLLCLSVAVCLSVVCCLSVCLYPSLYIYIYITLEGPKGPHLRTPDFGGHVIPLTLQYLWPRPPVVGLGGPSCKSGHSGWS